MVLALDLGQDLNLVKILLVHLQRLGLVLRFEMGVVHEAAVRKISRVLLVVVV